MFGSVYNAKCTYTAHTNAVHDKLELFVATIRKENRFFNSFRRGNGVPCTVSMFHTLTSRIGNGNNFLRCRSIDITKLKQTRQTNLLSFGLVRFEMCRLTLYVCVLCAPSSHWHQLAPSISDQIKRSHTRSHIVAEHFNLLQNIISCFREEKITFYCCLFANSLMLFGQTLVVENITISKSNWIGNFPRAMTLPPFCSRSKGICRQFIWNEI